MHRSLNFLIDVPAETSESHPKGEELSRRIASLFAHHYRVVEYVDNWRDVGWQFRISVDNEDYRIVVSYLANGNALLQVSPSRIPSVVMRFFGLKPSATHAGLMRRQKELIRLFTSFEDIAVIGFRYDGMPRPSDGSVATTTEAE